MKTFESFGADLKRHRSEKNISLMDISASTRINLKFLEALETGNFSILPQTYVRAFLREYADAVGMNPDGVLKTYDEILLHKQGGEPKPATKPQSVSRKTPDSGALAPVAAFARQNALFVVFVLLVAVFVVYLFRQTSDAPRATTIAETPFDRVVEENAAAMSQRDTAVILPAVTNPAAVDSLSLVMTTTDSVWMTITLDDGPTREYLFAPDRRGRWTAKESFTLTMGNAGGATFVLNGKPLGTLGRPGAVIRNVRISAENLSSP
ncbi:MAG: helix-turn-helix domain-containing protein [Bacteroidia bacterium]|nr:MAG: helix-turn-helix domain-containing protein [Bacteroidia bacterium]